MKKTFIFFLVKVIKNSINYLRIYDIIVSERSLIMKDVRDMFKFVDKKRMILVFLLDIVLFLLVLKLLVFYTIY